eukprot:TRINITY_DN23077_c0_g1_i2.p1 TRINITY_DN23077_c0_g1~~TRINITY_DN23077_c0_g1_i2.p1  ORF type:complete len:151 (+),score=14.98 TRINITY_DN23077_c0_g1_i2:165-617(+)
MEQKKAMVAILILLVQVLATMAAAEGMTRTRAGPRKLEFGRMLASFDLEKGPCHSVYETYARYCGTTEPNRAEDCPKGCNKKTVEDFLGCMKVNAPYYGLTAADVKEYHICMIIHGSAGYRSATWSLTVIFLIMPLVLTLIYLQSSFLTL